MNQHSEDMPERDDEVDLPRDEAPGSGETAGDSTDEAAAEALVQLDLPSEALDRMPSIPSMLHSAYEEGLFSRCNVCEKLLRNRDRIYKLEKVYRSGECVFEIALCGDCALDQQRQLSEDSRKAIEQFLSEHYQPSGSLDHCHFCRGAIADSADRTLNATCARDRLVLPVIVVCNSCAERTQELLSRETRDTFSDFIETHFPGVPAEWEPSPTFVA